MERIGKSHYNNALSRSLISYAALALICNIVSWYDVCYLVRIHREDAPVVLGIVVISLICLGAATIFFVFKILRSIIDMEKKIAILRQEYGDEPISEKAGSYEMLGTIQYLLQKEAVTDMMRKQAEIDALQNQINPHFLYNTLETIRGQAIVSGNLEIADTTKALADIFRYNISKKGSIVTLKEELDNVNAYMKIQKIRFRDRFSIMVEMDENVEMLKIPKLLVQPLVENSIKHGLEPKRGAGLIKIRIFRTEDSLFIIVEDDGVGMTIEELKTLNRRLRGKDRAEIVNKKSTHVGLPNIEDRIQMIYGNKYGVNVESIKNVGTKASLILGILE